MPTGWNKQIKSDSNSNIYKEISDRDKKLTVNNSSEDFKKEAIESSRIDIFIPEQPKKQIDELIVSPTVMARIETALSRIQFHHILYSDWNLKSIDPHGKRTTINLFGPPGTGKTFCAEAIANKLGKTIIKVNYAEIESKYVGETPKNITAAFKKAQETNSVLFFDEADSILGKRLTNVTQSADHGVNVTRSVMLLQLDKFDGVVIFATNLAKNYDPAFVRRIIAHIEFELPDKECLVRLWNYLLPIELPIADDINPDWLAEQSEGLAGGDILNIVITAASQAVQRIGDARRVLRSDIVQALNWVKNAKDKIGSSFNDKQISTKQTVIKPDDLPIDILPQYERVTAQQDDN